MNKEAIPTLDGLKAALGYVRAYRGRTFVLKAGGEVLREKDARDGFAAQAAVLARHSHGDRPRRRAHQRDCGGPEPELVAE